MNNSNLIHKHKPIKEYVADGMTVKIYFPDCSDSERTKTDINIRERITDIISEVELKEVSNF